MPVDLTWQDITARLALTLLASSLIGFNRGFRGHAAGLRTTILVGLAAAVAMIQANLLLGVSGKTAASFVTLDAMRLPLGILTGVGFIGGGAILKRGDLITGVTTAATLWAVTVIGLCFGGGQIGLGIAGTALIVGTVLGLKSLDRRIPRDQRAKLVIDADGGAPIDVVRDLRLPAGYQAEFVKQSRAENGDDVELTFELRWHRPEIAGPPLDLLQALGDAYKVRLLELPSKLSDD